MVVIVLRRGGQNYIHLYRRFHRMFLVRFYLYRPTVIKKIKGRLLLKNTAIYSLYWQSATGGDDATGAGKSVRSPSLAASR